MDQAMAEALAPLPDPVRPPSRDRDGGGPAPVLQGERIESLDVLRGVAVLGILVMNIQSFSMPEAAYVNPTVYGDLTGIHWVSWYACHLLADMKFMTIFTMLFGAGIVLMTSRAEARTGQSADLHYRRMGWLILFGLLHAHLLWYGDILYFYGMCGLAAYLFRGLPPGLLLTLGLALVAVMSLISLGFGLTLPFWPEDAIAGVREGWEPSAETIAAELAAYRGSWLRQMSHRVPTALFFETFLFLIVGFVWRILGGMLIGMALLKWGVLSAQRSRACYGALIAVAVLVGLPLVAWGAHRNIAADWALESSFFLASQLNYWGSLLVSMGWIGLVMLACQAATLRRWVRPLASVGRMAFSNYIMQTVICTFIFYGHGLGLFGKVDRLGQLAIVAGIWVVQIAWSMAWFRLFAAGPLEWLWRSLTYWRVQPLGLNAQRGGQGHVGAS